jgi:hypothetical protein
MVVASQQERGNLMTNITSGHVRAFQAVRSQLYDNITLASCLINNEPGVAIVMVDDAGENKIAVMPLFVSITESMNLVFEGQGTFGGSGDGGPKDPREEFEVNKEILQPAPH